MRLFLRFLLAATFCSATPLYTVTDLGAVSGSTATAFAVSSNGLAAGWSSDALGNTQALLFGGTGPASLWLNGQATGINNSGQVSGTAWIGGSSHGVVRSGASTVDLGPSTSAAAINDAGQVAASAGHALLYQNGTTTDLGALPGGNWSLAEGLSGNGAVTGYSDSSSGIRAFIWTSTTGMTELDTLGGNASYGMSVNDPGIVSGSAATASGYLHAVVWVNGLATDLGTLGGGNSYGYGINDDGISVGYSWLAGNAATHAFIVINGVMVDLNSLLAPADSGWIVTAAYGINDTSQIVGEATWNGRSHAVLLNDPPSSPSTPGAAPSAVPEPATLLPAATALALLTLRRAFTRSR
ncbi:MAG TPA: hypothetical protein VMJ34_03755 [Bryobacteraceae bacterium]|nr:hypothetical protein [Bryobacteraceae bacterium]